MAHPITLRDGCQIMYPCIVGLEKIAELSTMARSLPLDEMTTSEKLRVLEQIWEDLCRTPEDIPAPSWHADVLRARESRIREGSAQFTNWNEAKDRIRDSAK